ncbi:MAG: peptide deformylase [Verrucomicrobia bacterium]|nr:peptide deformylase [Verrucomicrobiota bacterium]MCH8511456.1 peptide deformylase [Kiritimatiellia bacterium]
MKLPLVFYGDPGLRQQAEPVTVFDDKLLALSRDMVETMHAEAGIGLAGPQIGVPRRIFVMEIPPEMDEDETGARLNPDLNGPLVVVNPELLELSKNKEEMEEGCLSIPDIRGKVRRPVSVTLRFQDVEGRQREMRLQDLAARCAQHETDHLDGILFVDLLSQVKRVAIKGKLRKLKEQTLQS